MIALELERVSRDFSTPDGRTYRALNDVSLAVPETPVNPALFGHIDDLPHARVTEIEHFFVSYNQVQGREYKPIKHGGPEEAEEALTAAKRRYTRRQKQ